MRSVILASLFLAAVAQAQPTPEVLAVQVSRLPADPFQKHGGALPDTVFAFDMGVQNWNSGTAVLLRLPASATARIGPGELRLVMFKDDAGTDLTIQPKDAPEDPFNKRKPVSLVIDKKTGDAYVVVASLRPTSSTATRVAGEFEVPVLSSNETHKTSSPIEPKPGAVADLAPFSVKITDVKELAAGEGPEIPTIPEPPIPPGAKRFPEPPKMSDGRPTELHDPSRPTSNEPRTKVSFNLCAEPGSQWLATKLEVKSADGKVTSFDTNSISDTHDNYGRFSITRPKLSPLTFKVTAVNLGTSQTVTIKFMTGLGIGAGKARE